VVASFREVICSTWQAPWRKDETIKATQVSRYAAPLSCQQLRRNSPLFSFPVPFLPFDGIEPSRSVPHHNSPTTISDIHELVPASKISVVEVRVRN
jgi:hypothetical protein